MSKHKPGNRTGTGRTQLTYAKGRCDDPSPFGRLLYHAISNMGLSANAWSQTVGISSGFISGIYQGIKRPSMDSIEQWANALNLHGSVREEFMILAALTHTPPLISLRLVTHDKFAADTLAKWSINEDV